MQQTNTLSIAMGQVLIINAAKILCGSEGEDLAGFTFAELTQVMYAGHLYTNVSLAEGNAYCRTLNTSVSMLIDEIASDAGIVNVRAETA